MVELLLRAGASIRATNLYGYTALGIARNKRYAEIVELLRAHGAQR